MSSKVSYKAKVLVVDDNEVNLEVATGLLEILGCTVECANNGEEALEMVKNKRYDVIFMDIAMPDMDGILVTDIIKGHEEKENIPPNERSRVIALSANINSKHVIDLCQKSGMEGCIAKPVTIEALDKKLNAMGLVKVYKQFIGK